MSSTELKMQPTIHLEDKSGYLPRPCPGWIGGIENATHNTFGTQKLHTDAVNIQIYLPNVLWVAFSNPSGSLLLVNHRV
jgi:hypothetical protein